MAPIPVAPTGDLNADWITWNTNAINALQSGAATVGDPTQPSFYTASTTFGRKDLFSTAGDADATPLPGSSPLFPSWKGIANPPAPFNSQYGNAVFFPVRILGNGTRIRLANLSNVMTSNDPANFWNGTGTGLAGPGRNYSFFRQGLDYGPDHLRGTADDLLITAGAGTQQVDEILYSGVAVWQQTSSSYGGSPQNMIDQSVNAFYAQFPFTQIANTYTLRDDAGAVLAQGTLTATLVPEPVAFLPLAAGAMLFARRARPSRKP